MSYTNKFVDNTRNDVRDVISINKIAGITDNDANTGNNVIGPICGSGSCGLGACSTCVNYEYHQKRAVMEFVDIVTSDYAPFIYDSAIDPDGMAARYTLLFDNRYGMLLDMTRCSFGSIFPRVEATLLLVTNSMTHNHKPLYWPDATASVRDTFLNRHPTTDYYGIDEISFIIREVQSLK